MSEAIIKDEIVKGYTPVSVGSRYLHHLKKSVPFVQDLSKIFVQEKILPVPVTGTHISSSDGVVLKVPCSINDQ